MDISKIKLGNTTYDIKDIIARTGFATATLADTTITSGQNSYDVSRLSFYGNNAKTQELGHVDFTTLKVGGLGAQYVVANGVVTSEVQLENSGDSIADSTSISVKKVNSKPVLVIDSTTDGSSSGTATEVQLPIGANGTVALLSDITTANNNKVGHGNKSVVTGANSSTYTSLHYYANEGDVQPLFSIPLDSLTTLGITAGGGHFGVLDAQYIGFYDQTNFGSDFTAIKPDTQTVNNTTQEIYTFTVGKNSIEHTVVLPMTADGTIALTSDIETASNNLQDQIDDINTLLGVDGEEYADTIDTYQEIKAFLASMAESPDLATTLSNMQLAINSKLTTSDIYDGLDSTATNKALSANQGKVLDGKITTLSNAAVKKISLNGEEISPSSGTVTLPNTVTKIQLNGKDQTLDTSGTGSAGKVNLTGIVTKINFNGTDVTPVTNSTDGSGTVTISEADPVFTAHVAHSITQTDINNWNATHTSISSVLTDVQYTTSGSGNSTKHLLQKKVGTGSFASFVELPTARYINDNNEETLELILAKAPSA